MPLITTAIPNLIGGVSQQPPAIRGTNEAQTIDNAVPSPVEGLMKRPPTEHIAAVADAGGTLRYVTSSQPPFIHMIERDQNERYLLIVQNDGTPDIYDLAGNRKGLTLDTGVTFGTASKDQRRALTIGDVTFVCRNNLPVALQNTLSAQTPTNYNRAALVWIRQANYNREHIVKLTSGGTTQTFMHVSRSVKITKEGSSGTNGTYTNVLLKPISTSSTKCTTGPRARIVIAGGKATEINILEDAIGWSSENIDALLEPNNIADVGNINGFEVEIKSLSTGEIGTEHVARALYDGSSQGYIGPYGGIDGQSTYNTSELADGVIYIKGSADFTVVVEDDFAGDGLVYIRDEVERFEDLPPSAPNNYTVRVMGTPESTVDDYYVKFVADNGTFSRGVWEETIAPGVKYLYDYGTMPLLLIRQADGSFFLKKADGTAGTGTYGGANYSQYKWESRLVGNDDTNPVPSFVGLGIKDMVYYQNRLGFMSGENIIFSQTSEFFNFYRTTTLDVVDTDPIDIASSSPRVGIINAAVPFNGDLILFTPNSQMVLRGGEILTPRSVAVLPVAEFENQSSVVRPIPSATSVFFTYPNGGYVGLRELVPQPALDGSYLANDLTNNVSRYIPGIPSHMAATTHDNIAVIVSQGNLYCYRYFNLNNERVQSAWFRFTFENSGSVANAKVIWADFIESDLYVVVQRGRNTTTDYVTIEKIRMGAGLTDAATSNKPWVTCLDQRKYFAAGQGTYNSTTDLTTWNLHAPLSYAAGRTVVVTKDGYLPPIASGTSYNISTGAVGTVSVRGNYSAKDVWIGTAYTMNYEFSTPYLKGAAGRSAASILTGRYQLRYLTLQYADSGYFKATVQIKNEDTYEYPFTGEILGTATSDTVNLTTGIFRIPLFSKNDNLTIRIINDSPLPSKILSGELEALYNDRATRFNA